MAHSEPHPLPATRDLESAFQAFTEMSRQLEDSYRQLEDRVAALNAELAAARSERLKQLAEKERLADRLERLLGVLPAGVIVLDGEGVVSECNPRAQELLGEPLLGRPWREVVSRSFVTEVRQGSDVALRNGKRVSVSRRALGHEPGQIILLMDITEQHALQQLVARNQRLSAMGEMAARLAHQIRTPLASALLYISHLGRDDLSAEDRCRFTDKVHNRLRHLDGMVNAMLRYVRSGGFDMEEVEVASWLAELQQAIELLLQPVGGRLEVVNGAPGARLLGNGEALHSALLNLATNAVEATGEGVVLRLSVAPEQGGRLRLVLQDNGPGIEEEQRERIFSPFFTTRPDGTGLGLAVVKAVVDAHRGEVQVESVVGEGARFILLLPMAGRRSGGGDGALSSAAGEAAA